MTVDPWWRRQRWCIVACLGLVLLLPALAYASTLGGAFQGDDVEGIWRATAFDDQMPSLGYPSHHWRPLADASIRLDHAVHALDPAGYRLTNLVLNALAAAAVGAASLSMVSALELRAARTPERAAALVVAVAFAVWPSHTEGVAWVAGRGDLLMTALAMSALTAFAVGLEARRRWPANALGTAALVGAAPVLTLAALAAKESAIAVPAVAVLLGWRHLAARLDGRGRLRSLWSALGLAAPMFAATALWFLVRRIVVGSYVGGFSDVLGNAGVGDVVLRSVWMLVRPAVPVVPSVGVLVVAGVSLVTVGATWWGTRRSSGRAEPLPSGDGRAAWWTVGTLVACAFVASLPVAPLGAGIGVVSGERLTYFASGFLLVAAGRCWSALLARRRAVGWTVAASVVLVATLWSADLATRWRAGADESGRVISALGVLPRDQPAVVLGTSERTENGIPVVLNALGAAVVLYHGWTDPSLLTDRDGDLDGSIDATTWVFDGSELRRLEEGP